MLTLARDALRAYLPQELRGTDDSKEPALPEVVPSELNAEQQQQTRKLIAVLNHKLGTNFLVMPASHVHSSQYAAGARSARC